MLGDCRRVGIVLVLCTMGPLACSDDDPIETVGASGGQFEEQFTYGDPQRVAFVLVVDDGPDEDASELRSRVLTEFEEAVQTYHDDCMPSDPAATAPLTYEAVVVWPSAPADERFVGPDTEPQLQLATRRMSAEELDPWLSALARAVEARPATADEQYAPLAATSDMVALLRGEREPQWPSERSLMQHLGQTDYVDVILASAREDQSPGAATSYALDRAAAAHPLLDVHAIVPAGEPSGCGPSSPATPRFAEWGEASGVRPRGWTPGGCPAFVDYPMCERDFERTCMPRPVELEDGRAACRLFVTMPEPRECPVELGWIEAEARWSKEPDAEGRVCEVVQLEGAALEACRSDLQCTGCAPGFCITEVPTLQGECAAGDNVPLPRLVGGADRAAAGGFRLICNK